MQLFCCCCILLLILVPTYVAAENGHVYHANRRFWTSINKEGQTYVAVNLMRETAKLIFPYENTFPVISFYVPPNPVCKEGTPGEINIKLWSTTAPNSTHEYLRIKIKMHDSLLTAFVYERCQGHSDDGISNIFRRDVNFEMINPKHCFPRGVIKNTNSEKSKMNFEVVGNLKCSAFFVLPPNMKLEDIPMIDSVRLPLNQTLFPDHDDAYWWKSGPDPMLPQGITFDANHNPTINILKSSIEKPYYFRIGTNQSIPSFVLKYDQICNTAIINLFLNLHSSEDCVISVSPHVDGFKLTTKGNTITTIKTSTRSTTLVFDQAKLYVKVIDPVNILELEICDISNETIPEDQFALQAAIYNVDGSNCDAKITLVSKEIENGIEVLIDQSPRISTTESAELGATDSILESTTSADIATASFDWWIWLIIVLVILVIAFIATTGLVYICCIKKKSQKKKKSKISRQYALKTSNSVKEPKMPTFEMKTAEENSVVKKENKKIAKELKKKANIEDLKTAEIPFETVMTKEAAELLAFSRNLVVLDATQDDANPDENAAEETRITKKNKLPEELQKHANIYGDSIEGNDSPYDYHLDEDEFKATIDFENRKENIVPNTRLFGNLWTIFGRLWLPPFQMRVFCNYQNDFGCSFYVRDLVADRKKYGPYLKLANRILERDEHMDVPPDAQDDPYDTIYLKPIVDVETKPEQSNLLRAKIGYRIRVFITSYDPLTIELHCRGRCPYFFFSFMRCEVCIKNFDRVFQSNWTKSQGKCVEDWDTFVCRVKRTPPNSHQFLSYNGEEYPTNAEQINHIFVIRGAYSTQQNVRKCVHKCSFQPKHHKNGDVKID